MPERTRPKKPARNPAHIAFPKSGAPRFVEEHMPREQEPLEAALGAKFQGSLERLHGIVLTPRQERSEPADLSYDLPDGTALDLQVVEVVDRNLRAVTDMRTSYAAAAQVSLGDRLQIFSGCQLTLVDSGEPPYLPPAHSEKGQCCLAQLVSHIETVGSEVSSLQVGHERLWATVVGEADRSVALVVERFAPTGDGPGPELHWSGAGPSYPTKSSRGFLTAAIRAKVNKRYAKPDSAQFWLLAYSIDVLILPGDPDIGEARQELERSNHPFDVVWFLYPYANQTGGSLVRVWPSVDG